MRSAPILAGLSLALAGCAGDAGGAAARGGAPLAAVRAASAPLASAAVRLASPPDRAPRSVRSSRASRSARATSARTTRAPRSARAASARPDRASRSTRSTPDARRRPAVPASSAGGDDYVRTPAARARPSAARSAAPAPASSAPRLAALACEQYAAGMAGSMPPSVRARGAARALAVLTDSVASALLGMPVVAPRASLPARERLDDARARIAGALAAGDDAKATAIAEATVDRLRAYARALGIDACG